MNKQNLVEKKNKPDRAEIKIKEDIEEMNKLNNKQNIDEMNDE